MARHSGNRAKCYIIKKKCIYNDFTILHVEIFGNRNDFIIFNIFIQNTYTDEFKTRKTLVNVFFFFS